MVDGIKNSTLFWLVTLFLAAIGGTWKVMDILFIQPRDFRISVLEKNVDEIRKEIQRGSTRVIVKDDVKSIDQEGLTATESSTPNMHQKLGLQNDINLFYSAWDDDSKTDLQKDHFEESFIGQKAIWKSKFKAVKQSKDGYLWVSLGSPNDEIFGLHVIAVFDPKYKEALLLISEDEEIVVTGIIDSFGLSPILRKCSVSKKI